MKKYEFRDHLSEQLFRAIGDYFANFSRSIGSISEEIYAQLAAYLSYTLTTNVRMPGRDEDFHALLVELKSARTSLFLSPDTFVTWDNERDQGPAITEIALGSTRPPSPQRRG